MEKDHTPDNTYKLIGKKTGVEISKANPEDITPENYPTLVDKINHQNVALKDVIDSISKALNINIIMTPGVDANKKISIVSHSPITVAEAYQAFLSALAIHDMTLIRSGSFFKVITRQDAIKNYVEVYTGKKKINVDQFLTRIIKLKYISVSNLETKIKPFMTSTAKVPSSVLFFPPTNTVVISDYSSNVEKLRKIIESLDIPTAEDIIVKIFSIHHAQASNLVKVIKNLKTGIKQQNQYKSRSRYYRPRGKSSSESKTSDKDTGQEINIIDASSYDRTNSIIVTGNQTGINKVSEIIKELDTEKRTGGEIHVYKVRYSTAEALSQTLNSVIGNGTHKTSSAKEAKTNIPQVKSNRAYYSSDSQKSQNAATALSFKDIKIIPETNTNSLIIVSNEMNYKTIKDILEEIDVSRNQVFVKAIIMEISAERANDWKIANYYLPPEGGGIARIGYGLSSLEEMATEKEGATLLFPLSLFLNESSPLRGSKSGFTDVKNLFSLTKPGASLPEMINLPTLSSFVTFLQKTVGASVLSTPQVIAMDHQKASVSITDEIPQVAESVTPTIGLSNTNRVTSTKAIEVETQLEFTPHINPNVNSIRMEISQKIDNVIKSTNVPSALQSTNLAVRKREIKTHITLKDRETAVLGGLVKESNSKTNAKIPILGDLPLIGWLFKNSKVDRTKSNLIVFITPHIIRSAEEHKNILSSKLKERMEFIRNFTGNEDPYKKLTQEMLPDNVSSEEQSSTFLEEDYETSQTEYEKQKQVPETSDPLEENDNYYKEHSTETNQEDYYKTDEITSPIETEKDPREEDNSEEEVMQPLSEDTSIDEPDDAEPNTTEDITTDEPDNAGSDTTIDTTTVTTDDESNENLLKNTLEEDTIDELSDEN